MSGKGGGRRGKTVEEGKKVNGRREMFEGRRWGEWKRDV